MLYLLPLLLAVLLTVLALRRSDTRRRGLRVAAGLLAAAGLALAALPPSRSRPAAAPGAATAVLLTPGYSSDTLAALLSSLGTGTPVWRFAPTETTAALSADTPVFRNASAIRAKLPGLRRLHVLGRGLPAADVPALAGLELHPHADAPAAGFRQATWDARPTLGEAWVVSGSFAAAQAGPVWLRLRAAGTVRDSARLPGGTGAFRLSFTPRAAGRAVYALEARSSGRALVREPVPIEVQAPEPLRVLLLAATPSFELRFLKDYLAGRQYAVALRTGLSRGLTQTEFLNLPNPPALGSLSPALLARFDVVITDAATLASLGGSETAALRTAVANGTAGLLLLADAPTLPRQLPGGAAFGLQARPAAAAATAQPLRWPAAPAGATALVPATLRPATNLRPLISSGSGGQLVAAARRLGLGAVVVSTITETFPWQLRGQPAVYGAYWSCLLGAARPPRPAALSIALLSHWPRPNTPLELRIAGATAGPLTLAGPNGATVAAARRPDARVPEWSSATYWPATAGWHEARVGAARHWFYVYAPGQWRGPEQPRWQLAAAQAATTTPGVAAAAAADAPPTTAGHETWPRWWGYALFLVGAGLLWLEEKL
ncbi:hypothetical protein [Hymenobacter actinosclerus]|uniref:Uncharacterized protein n=1 Tax=Hymenobacter actinosclerus TaxID=82805 RepID=A0A1H9YXT5_9BACT|nr:hypothetical protein [Hymenobacter actinosclerus]SES73920.1 hypothetical protein SAMN04487998_0132 [Hymenobacter actinosclerus]